MAEIKVRSCDVCTKIIAPGARRLAANIELSIINGHEKADTKHFEDLCGEECLHAAVNATVRSVEEIR